MKSFRDIRFIPVSDRDLSSVLKVPVS